MKPFQTLLLLAVIILIGGGVTLWWSKSIQDATIPFVVDESVEIVDEPTEPVDVVDEPVKEPANQDAPVQPTKDEPTPSVLKPIILMEDLPAHKDSFSFVEDEAGRSVWVEGNILYVNVGYSGGCQEHEFTAYWNGLWAESAPPITGILIVHDAHDDFCEAAFGPQTLQFDLSSVTSVYADFHFAVQGYEESVSLFVGSNY